MTNYQTPGVYVEEISTLAPSVAAVATAVPAFIGLTERAQNDATGQSLTNVPTKIKNMDDYVAYFGKGQKATITAAIAEVVEATDGVYKFVSRSVSAEVSPSTNRYYMYESIKLYFDNGGGPCYVISTGDYEASLDTDLLKAGLDELAKEDEPTLILFPDVYGLGGDLTIYNLALAQCSKLQDRFLIMDVPQGTEASDSIDTDALSFRELVIGEYLQYGAAYYPDVRTTLSYEYDFASSATVTQTFADPDGNSVTIADSTAYPDGFYDGQTIEALEGLNKGVYNDIIKEANKTKAVTPSSGAIAGVYFQVDNDRGVWKAPANIALTSVSSPALKITTDDQKSLNVHSTGKSINAIRSFTGKGTLVWGARTLDGNDNEWRYIQVRRFFNYVEESIQKSISWAVFEGNTTATWTRVKVQIETFLTGIWKQGGLTGASTSEAFFVNVGLGSTMSSQDILEGRMNVEIGLAAVRPAEFIILKFSHFIQQS